MVVKQFANGSFQASKFIEADDGHAMRIYSNSMIQVVHLDEQQGMKFAIGSLQWNASDAVSNTYVVSGLGFQPKALRFYCMGLSSNTNAAVSNVAHEMRSVGFAISTTERRCVSSSSANNVTAADCGTSARNDAVLAQINGSPASIGRLDLSSIDSNGFTLIVDEQSGIDMTVFWGAWGGDDITVAVVGDAPEPASTGIQDYTVTGFVAGASDQVVMFAGVQSTAALNSTSATDSGFCIGYSTGAGDNNIVVCGNSDDGSGTMDTDNFIRRGNCLAMIVVAGGTAVARAQLTQFNTNGFRLNWDNILTANRRNIWLAIKGGQWSANSITFDSSTMNATSTVDTLSFKPLGLCTIGGQGAEQTGNTSGTTSAMTIGDAKTPLNRHAMAVRDQTGVPNSIIEHGIRYDGIWNGLNTGTTGIILDLDSINNNGFVIKVTNNNATGSPTAWLGYLAFAANPPAVGSPAKLYANGTFTCPQFIEVP